VVAELSWSVLVNARGR